MIYPAETFDPAVTFEACAHERCTSLYGVPTMFIAELAHERFSEFDLAPLRTGIMAGSPCPIEVMKRVSSEMGIDEISIAFGMTETSPVTTPSAPPRRSTSSAGCTPAISRRWTSRVTCGSSAGSRTWSSVGLDRAAAIATA